MGYGVGRPDPEYTREEWQRKQEQDRQAEREWRASPKPPATPPGPTRHTASYWEAQEKEGHTVLVVIGLIAFAGLLYLASVVAGYIDNVRLGWTKEEFSQAYTPYGKNWYTNTMGAEYKQYKYPQEEIAQYGRDWIDAWMLRCESLTNDEEFVRQYQRSDQSNRQAILHKEELSHRKEFDRKRLNDGLWIPTQTQFLRDYTARISEWPGEFKVESRQNKYPEAEAAQYAQHWIDRGQEECGKLAAQKSHILTYLDWDSEERSRFLKGLAGRLRKTLDISLSKTAEWYPHKEYVEHYTAYGKRWYNTIFGIEYRKYGYPKDETIAYGRDWLAAWKERCHRLIDDKEYIAKYINLDQGGKEQFLYEQATLHRKEFDQQRLEQSELLWVPVQAQFRQDAAAYLPTWLAEFQDESRLQQYPDWEGKKYAKKFAASWEQSCNDFVVRWTGPLIKYQDLDQSGRQQFLREQIALCRKQFDRDELRWIDKAEFSQQRLNDPIPWNWLPLRTTIVRDAVSYIPKWSAKFQAESRTQKYPPDKAKQYAVSFVASWKDYCNNRLAHWSSRLERYLEASDQVTKESILDEEMTEHRQRFDGKYRESGHWIPGDKEPEAVEEPEPLGTPN